MTVKSFTNKGRLLKIEKHMDMEDLFDFIKESDEKKIIIRNTEIHRVGYEVNVLRNIKAKKLIFENCYINDLRFTDLILVKLEFNNCIVKHFELITTTIRRIDCINSTLDQFSLKNIKTNNFRARASIFTGAFIDGNDLSDSSFVGSTFYRSTFHCTNLSKSNFVESKFSGCNFVEVNLIESQIRNSIFPHTRFSKTHFNNIFIVGPYENKVFKDSDVRFDCSGFHSVCPEEGSFIAWKKGIVYAVDEESHYNGPTKVGVLIKLLIPNEAKRTSGFTRKCRCSKARVLSITSLDDKIEYKYASSCFTPLFKYEVGKFIYPDAFDDIRWKECSNGIHFFMTKAEAISYDLF